ncbi:ABC transporter permease [Microvirga sp. 17 mud 1-3]|uniref:ABC transporter permease n=1 Tax=Microvirga sp. 17 mud 1-3 TaxID=2082949 RepID=UPI000D6B0363|nr:peptide ABC transporter permease [Microvirga sp. 17 mud 1-3]
MTDTIAIGNAAPAKPAIARLFRAVRRNPLMFVGALILILMALTAIAAPLIAGDPVTMQPSRRLLPPSETFLFGTDHLGRDVFARTIYGARVSLIVGLSVSAVSVLIGMVLGLLAGYFRGLDAPIMRVMDGLMAIPSILLAIAMVALMGSSLGVVMLAIIIPEIPRVVRLVRSVTLSTRENQYVEAAVATGTRTGKILVRHILPSTIAPLIVQATYVCASAILVEASLSFLGAGMPPDVPTWGNMIASSRLYLGRAPWTIFCPALALGLVVLAVNLLGDGLRDRFDPRMARRM